tara:strand:- start:374 stop:1837 length:1464 start_codon:yes stop_codon:yes gene_type:complete
MPEKTSTSLGCSIASGMTEKCGVVGISINKAVALPLYYSLYALQHRGQESAGIVTHDGFQQHSHVEMGLVGDAIKKEDLEKLKGTVGIGHVRYPTEGSLNKQCAQPFSVSFRGGSLALSHNGNLINSEDLRSQLEEFGHTFISDGDTEVMTHELARNLLSSDRVTSVHQTMKKIHGSYSLVIMQDDTVMGLRDPLGNRPLCIGKLDGGYVIASESCVIDTLGGELLRDVSPGELIILHPNGSGIESHQLTELDHSAHCFFEYIYFSRPDSIIDKRLVYDVRCELGKKLWEDVGVKTDIVMPVPDSGRAYALGYAEAAAEENVNIRLAEGLMKNRYIGRTFIMPDQDSRERAVRLKLNPIKSTVSGKSITLIDDSIVRGTTSKLLIKLLRDHQVSEVHLRIGSPQIISPCYMGINMANRDELIASGKTLDEIKDFLGADSVAYLPIDSIAEVIGKSKKDLCLGCVTEKYPYDIEGELTDRHTKRPTIN